MRQIQKQGYEVPVRIVRYKLVEQAAFDLEIKLIGKIGRADLKLGPLTNKTVGGDGMVGQVVSKKTRKKLSGSVKAYAASNRDLLLARASAACTTKAGKTNTEKATTRKKQSDSAILARSKVTKKAKKAISEKRVATILSKTDTEKALKAAKFRATLLGRTPEQKAATAEKKRLNWFSKPAKERNKIIEARRASNSTNKTPEERAAFSAKMSKINKERYSTWTPEQLRQQGRKLSEGRRKAIA